MSTCAWAVKVFICVHNTKSYYKLDEHSNFNSEPGSLHSFILEKCHRTRPNSHCDECNSTYDIFNKKLVKKPTEERLSIDMNDCRQKIRKRLPRPSLSKSNEIPSFKSHGPTLCLDGGRFSKSSPQNLLKNIICIIYNEPVQK